MHENVIDPIIKGCKDGDHLIIEYLDSDHSICESEGIHKYGQGVQIMDHEDLQVVPYSMIIMWRSLWVPEKN